MTTFVCFIIRYSSSAIFLISAFMLPPTNNMMCLGNDMIASAEIHCCIFWWIFWNVAENYCCTWILIDSRDYWSLVSSDSRDYWSLILIDGRDYWYLLLIDHRDYWFIDLWFPLIADIIDLWFSLMVEIIDSHWW